MAQNKGNYQHGFYGTRTYKSWAEMKYRCGKRKNKIYKNISYCERWNKFENFLEDMGQRPKGTTLDRIDGTKGYFKKNCRWANSSLQAENRKSTHYFEFNGKKLMLKDWAKRLKIKRSALAQRIYVYKWPIKKAFREEVMSYRTA